MSTAAVHITTSQLRVVERKGCPKRTLNVMATSGGMDMQPENKNTFIYKKYSKVKTHLQLGTGQKKQKQKNKVKKKLQQKKWNQFFG